MASTTDPPSKPSDPTFRNYAPSQAKLYAQYRSAYPPQLLRTIIDLHKSTSPDPANCLSTLVDVGCGPGTATHYIGLYFDRAIGLDPGESMIETARSLSGPKTEFGVSSAETIDQALLKMGVWGGKEPCVDLITAANAAHWFDLPLFFSAAAKVLKPGGSIVFWCNGSAYIDREKYPPEVADKAQALMDKFELEVLKPYELKGNRLCRELYKNLVMPWDMDVARQKELGIDVFDKEQYVRKTWNEGGKLESDLEGGWMRRETNKWAIVKYALGTASPVTRFREKNKEALEKKEMEDCVDQLVKDLRECVGQDKQVVEGGTSTAVVMLKKRK